MSAQGNPKGAKPKPTAVASSSSKVPTSKKPAKTRAVVPKNLRTEQARLSFKSAESKKWVELPRIGKNKKSNIGPVVFSGNISITQKAQGNRCTLDLGKSSYLLQGGRFVLGSPEDNKEHQLVGYFAVIRPGSLRFDTDKGDDESIALASAHPLASLSSTFVEIRLVVSSDGTDWKQEVGVVVQKPEVLRGQLTQLCTGCSSANPESKWANIVKTDMLALRSESEAQEKQFGTMECRIVTHAGTGDRSVVPVIPTPGAKGKGKEVDTPTQPDPVTVPASEKLKTFQREANESRKAEKVNFGAELAAIDSRHAAEKASLEQELAERLRLLEQDIAAEEEGLLFEAQFE